MGSWSGMIGTLSGVADTVVQDLGAFGVIGGGGGANQGGHATTQVVRTNAAGGSTTITTTQTDRTSYVFVAVAAIALIVGVYLLWPKEHRSGA
jgi:hypothetical protein